MSEPGEFIDNALQYEASWSGPQSEIERQSTGLRFYGTSVGAVRATIRNALRRFAHLDHDAITLLSSELWSAPVFERRQAAIVLLQTNVGTLTHSDLTRIESFIRTAGSPHLLESLVTDVLMPMLAALDTANRSRADIVLHRWAGDGNDSLRHAVTLVDAPG